MNTPPTNRDEEIFAAAARLPEAERAAYLDAVCGDDHELRERVGRLLASHEASGFMRRPVDGLISVSPSGPGESGPEKSGDRIGNYKLLEQIGEGGFGTVWVADQEQPVRRQVALKILKLGMDTREVIARFEQERQALAVMDHPNIAKVFDAGATQFGRPYFVMELVHGIRITDYCDEAKLSTRERLRLFIAVCQAVQHAHQKGIIHRDLKPSNILVTVQDGVPVPKVIDFGVAKAIHGRLTEATITTNLEQMIGTPLYMSPEQAEASGGDVDTRSDIYSLGVLLYELLTGRTPFTREDLMKAGYNEIRRLICESEPRKPSSALQTMAQNLRTTVATSRHTDAGTLTSMVRGDLDWIVMKALEKDRNRRYETASGFAEDVRRHLANEPVTAAAPGAIYRIRKFARRNKLIFAASTIVLLSLLTGITVSNWALVTSREAERKTAAERDAKDLARKDAEAISTFLTEVFQSPDPKRDGRDIKVFELLDKASKKLGTSVAIQPAQRAKLQAALGKTYRGLGIYQNAISLLENARDYFHPVSGPLNPDALSTMNELAISYFRAGRRDEALKLREDVLLLSRKANGAEHPNTIASMINLANSFNDAGRLVEALKLGEEALALSRKVNAPEDVATLTTMNGLAVFYAAAGRENEALKLREELLPLSRKVNGPEHPNTLDAMSNLANSYGVAGRRGEALKLTEEALLLSRKVIGPEHSDTLVTMNNLASYYFSEGRRDEALKLAEEVLLLRRKVIGPEHPETLSTMNNLAVFYGQSGRQDEALKLEEELLLLRRKVIGSEHPDTLSTMGNLAVSYSDAGRLDEALKLNEEVLLLRRKVIGPEHPKTVDALGNLANSYRAAGRKDEAIKLGEEALALSRKVNGPEHPDTLGAMVSLAVYYSDAGRWDEALKVGEEVLPLRRKVSGPEHPDTLRAIANLGVYYSEAGRRDEALKLKEEAVSLRRKVLGPEHPDTLKAMTNLALSYFDASRWDKAVKLHEEVLASRRKINGMEHPDTLEAMINLAISSKEAGRLREAAALQEQALAIERRVLPPNHRNFATSLENMAEIYEKMGRLDEAAALRKEIPAKASEGAPANAAPKPPPAVRSGALPADDITKLEKALVLARKTADQKPGEAIDAMLELAAAYGADFSAHKAIKLGEEALSLSRRTQPVGDRRTIAALKALVSLYKSVDLDEDVRKLQAEILAAPK